MEIKTGTVKSLSQAKEEEKNVEYEETSLELLQRGNNVQIFDIVSMIQEDFKNGHTYEQMLKYYSEQYPNHLKQYGYFMKTAMQRELEPELMKYYKKLLENMNQGNLNKDNCDQHVSQTIFKQFYNEDKTPKNPENTTKLDPSNPNVQSISINQDKSGQSGQSSGTRATMVSNQEFAVGGLKKGFLGSAKQKNEKILKQQQLYFEKKQQRQQKKSLLKMKNLKIGEDIGHVSE